MALLVTREIKVAWTDVNNNAFISQYFIDREILFIVIVSDETGNNKLVFTFQTGCKDWKEDLFGWCDKKPMEFSILVVGYPRKRNTTKILKRRKELANDTLQTGKDKIHRIWNLETRYNRLGTKKKKYILSKAALT